MAPCWMVIGPVYSVPAVAVIAAPLALAEGVEGKLYVNVLVPVTVTTKAPSYTAGVAPAISTVSPLTKPTAAVVVTVAVVPL